MEDVVSFEIAKLLEKYDIPYYFGLKYYNYKGEFDGNNIDEIKELISSKQEKRKFNKYYKSIPAFKSSYIQKWLRKKHGIHIRIDCINEDWYYTIQSINNEFDYITQCEPNYDSYEKCLENGLKEALQMI